MAKVLSAGSTITVNRSPDCCGGFRAPPSHSASKVSKPEPTAISARFVNGRLGSVSVVEMARVGRPSS